MISCDDDLVRMEFSMLHGAGGDAITQTFTSSLPSTTQPSSSDFALRDYTGG
jgi:hypothetical protein